MRSTSETMRSVSSRDQPGQRAVLVAQPALQQLRSAADPRQRVLDLMGEHRGEAGDRARRAAMRHLTIDLVGHRALLKHHDDRARKLRHRRDIDVDDLLGAHARRGNVDAVLVDRRLPLADLIDQCQQRAAERRKARQAGSRQDRGARAEEVLGIGIGIIDEAVRPDHDHRPADGVENDLRAIEVGRFCRRGVQIHAACLTAAATSAKARCNAVMTAAGSVAVRIVLRVSAAADGAWRSRYQPRCLRACRRPLSTP